MGNDEIKIKKMKKYIKEYELEKQLFGEINKNFHKNKTLSVEEFFKIVIWKSNRAKGKVLKGIKESGKNIKKVMSEVYRARDSTKRVQILTDIKGIGLPIASAILTVCYPKEFTVLDYRVWNILLKDGRLKTKTLPGDISGYLEYVEICKNYARELNLNLRDFDKAMWGRSFYEDLKKFLKNLANF